MTTQSLGRPTRLIEGHTKVTGATRFTADLNRSDMLHARLVTTAAAIANAIADSIGARLTDLPMTPPRVLAAIQSIAT